MKKQKKFLQFLLFIYLLSFSKTVCLAQDVLSKIDQYLFSMTEKGYFSGTVLISENNSTIFSKAYGLSNREQLINNNLANKFRIGSITKQFTAAAILILQEQGKLSVEDKICKYIQDCPNAWSEITVHNLLTHTSGIENFTETNDYSQMMKQQLSVEQIIDRFKNKKLEYRPNYIFTYSNSNYILLGYIIEKVSGKSFQNFLQDSIFTPLNMKNTGYDNNKNIILYRAMGYTRDGDRFTNAPYLDMSIPFAAGGLYSTVEDLHLWEQSLYTEKILSAKSLQAMFTAFKQGYGYGWYIGKHLDRQFIYHGGWISGFAASIARFPQEKIAVIVLSNLDTAPVNTIAKSLSSILLKAGYESIQDLKTVKLDSVLYKDYIGQYLLNPNLTIEITKEEDKLVSQAKGYPKIELLPEGKDKFYAKEFNAKVVFARDEQGYITSLTLNFDSNIYTAKKICP